MIKDAKTHSAFYKKKNIREINETVNSPDCSTDKKFAPQIDWIHTSFHTNNLKKFRFDTDGDSQSSKENLNNQLNLNQDYFDVESDEKDSANFFQKIIPLNLNNEETLFTFKKCAPRNKLKSKSIRI